jgi:alpha-glucosidase
MGTMPPNQLKAVPHGPKRPRADDRDGERTPMQGDSSVGAGFSKGTPWLPVEANSSRTNVANEKQDPHSVYSWYSTLLKLRHENSALREGAYLPLETQNQNVFAFGRKAESTDTVIVVLNTSPKKQKVHITGLPGHSAKFGKVLMSTPPATIPVSQNFTVAPYGVLISTVE